MHNTTQLKLHVLKFINDRRVAEATLLSSISIAFKIRITGCPAGDGDRRMAANAGRPFSSGRGSLQEPCKSADPSFWPSQARSLKSTTTQPAVGGPKTFWEDQRAWRPKNLAAQRAERTKLLRRHTTGGTKNTHLRRWSYLTKFTHFLGGPNGPKICGGRTKTDFKDRGPRLQGGEPSPQSH